MCTIDCLLAYLTSATVLGPCWTSFRVWSPAATVAAWLLMVAPRRCETYASLAETAGKRLRLPVAEPDVAGLHRAVGKLVDHPDALEGIQHEIQRLIELQRRRLCGRLPAACWHGRVLVAIDASDLVLGTSRELIEAFGGPTLADGSIPAAHGKLIVAWDVRRKVVLGWHLAPYRSSERDLLVEVLLPLAAGTVVLLDRGYPSEDVLALLAERGLHVIVRMPGGKAAWVGYRNLLRQGSGIRESTLTKHGRTYRIIYKPRARGRSPSGRTPQRTILLTDLIDPAITAGSILAAYERRWAVETFFRELKVTVTTVERWHSRSTERLRLELQAVLIWFLLAALLEIARQVDALERGIMPDHRVIERVRLLRRIVTLIEDLLATGTANLRAVYDGLGKHLIPPRPGRHFKRRCKSPLGRSARG